MVVGGLVAAVFPGFVDPGGRGYDPLLAQEQRLGELALAAGLPLVMLRDGLGRLGPLSELTQGSPDVIHPSSALAKERIAQVLDEALRPRLQAP